MEKYEKEMRLCINFARKGVEKTSPNPMVGCVILSKAGEIISTGYHKKYGENHAERDALLKPINAKGSTLVVNLEPCNHYGKTPPCTDLIIEKGVKRVVYGMKDPNPLVSGKGIKKLMELGIEVVGPILEKECRDLNEIFVKNQEEKLPFIAIKTATTLDGKIADSKGNSKWITTEESRKYSKKLRKRYDAILTSSKTVITDNPQMMHKKKIILDRNLRTDLSYEIYKQGEILVFHSDKIKPEVQKKNVLYIPTPEINEKLDIGFIIHKIFDLGIMSVFVESGGDLGGSFLPYADKIYHFIAPKILGDNIGKSCFNGLTDNDISNCFEFELERIKKIGNDILNIYKR